MNRWTGMGVANISAKEGGMVMGATEIKLTFDTTGVEEEEKEEEEEGVEVEELQEADDKGVIAHLR
jgi:hypothetical protein